MKAILAYLVAAAIFGLVGAVCLQAGLLDRDIADGQQRAAAAEYGELEIALETAERYYGYASRLPWIGTGPVNEVRAQKAALQYWQRRYANLVPEAGDPLAGVPADNIDLQFLVTSAAYRQRAAQAHDRPSSMAALDASIAGYLTVLRNATRHADAAYNYEFLMRVREEIEKGRRKTISTGDPDNLHGHPGAQQERGDTRPFKVYVPLESEEIKKGTGSEAGKAPPIKRKG